MNDIETIAWELEDAAIQEGVVSKYNQFDWFEFAKDLVYGGKL